MANGTNHNKRFNNNPVILYNVKHDIFGGGYHTMKIPLQPQLKYCLGLKIKN